MLSVALLVNPSPSFIYITLSWFTDLSCKKVSLKEIAEMQYYVHANVFTIICFYVFMIV